MSVCQTSTEGSYLFRPSCDDGSDTARRRTRVLKNDCLRACNCLILSGPTERGAVHTFRRRAADCVVDATQIALLLMSAVGELSFVTCEMGQASALGGAGR